MTSEKVVALNPLDGLYQEYFLDYASYVILERAVPALEDGLKPVQRRILHSLFEINDGRYHKVANVIGHCMKYHPHGDQAIGDALVKLGQKDLLIDTQGNWGDYRTGDSAAAPRYIEARLTKFALEVMFNKDITDWQLSYDGRNQEPIHLPAKFPLVLAQGVEGIAVGLSTYILPHNFIELCKASIKALEGKSFTIFPDFPTAGYIDVSEYNKGKRGGKIKIRSHIEKVDKNKLAITQIPYTQTTNQIIDSVLKANAKGKINIKRITDNTAQHVEILIELPPNVNPDITIDALYAFTKCEDSVSPNACVILDNKPYFLTVNDILKQSTELTKGLIRAELLIEERDLLNKWHNASLEKIFIEERVYREIEEAESWEEVLEVVDKEMRKYIWTPSQPKEDQNGRLILMREFTDDDVFRLTEIKIRRISKYNKFKAEDYIKGLEEELAKVRHHLDHLVEYCIDYFQHLIDKYGKGRERQTEILEFEDIAVKKVAANNAKLYVDRKEGFIGTSIKGGEFICDCSDIDDIIAFTKDGKFSVVRIDEKVFVGKNIIHLNIWRKGDERTTYNLIYTDGKKGVTRAKRFNVKAITRDRQYDAITDHPNSKLHYFSANPNGEAEIVSVMLSPSSKARKKLIEFDFADLDIKGRGSQGNQVTKYAIRKVELMESGTSTLGKMKVWMDKITGSLNKDKRGHFVGEFDAGDQILILYRNGTYEVKELDLNLTQKLEASEILEITKKKNGQIITAVHYDSSKKWTLVKRFEIETSTLDQVFGYISESRGSELLFVSIEQNPKISFVSFSEEYEEQLGDFVDVKGWKAMGNKLAEGKIKKIKELPTEHDEKIKVGETIEFEIGEGDQNSLFDLEEE